MGEAWKECRHYSNRKMNCVERGPGRVNVNVIGKERIPCRHRGEEVIHFGLPTSHSGCASLFTYCFEFKQVQVHTCARVVFI